MYFVKGWGVQIKNTRILILFADALKTNVFSLLPIVIQLIMMAKIKIHFILEA